ncbi:CP family cyanate transporter-like MFS transporter OS=Castellaniella defragrans OX=75697 GN=HNR28_002849 PE=4 SV=1 [Castellaniella defragrans]
MGTFVTDSKQRVPSAQPAHVSALWLGVVLMLLAFNLRMLFPSLSVLLPEIIRHTGMSLVSAGYLTTLPVLCLGAFAPLAPTCARRFGIERTIGVALLLLAVGTILRTWQGLTGLFLGSALAGASIAVTNVLLPALVKRDFSKHVALMTALYTVTLNGGSAAAAALTLPIAHGFGDSWRVGVGIWALPPLLMAIVWGVVQRRRRAETRRAPSATRVRGLWRSPLAWQVTLFMGLQSALAYTISGWVAPILRTRGLDGTTAGLVTSVCIFMNVVGSLLLPPLIARFRDQRWLNVVLSLLSGAPLLGVLFAPLSTVWVWAVLQGIGQGGLFAMALTLIALRSPDSHVAAQLSSMVQTVGYLVASGAPLLIGLLKGWTGSFAACGWLFLVIMVASCLSGLGAGRARYVEAS